MLIKQSPSKVKRMVGYNEANGSIVGLPFVAMRKPAVGKEQRKLVRDVPYFVITSNPNFKIIKPDAINPFCWMHCYKDSSCLPSNAPHILMSESDFVDPIFFPVMHKSKFYDYVYFSCNDQSGFRYKGFDVFMEMLPTLNDMGLKGRLVFYVGLSGEIKIPIGKQGTKMLNRSNLEIVYKRFSSAKVARLMSKSRFTLFPNKADCSPRMISESILNNAPVVVNANIDGGWKYPEHNPAFGATFDPDSDKSIRTACSHALSLKGGLQEEWMKEYGFWNSSKKMADHLRPFGVIPEGITHVYFAEYRKAFQVKG